eukprot:TRINITY_DN14671_c0_g1_i1.p1 TRINITY_DN14671_c0_g1~~TRINITY_DN14671_c0_g1_i1.p1  ORF type:complete len:402 (-),score=103.18 TRINITY_DN14671_c0_g1_i1:124-1176(-)
MADPAPVAQTFFVDDFISSNFRLDGIVTVVDALHLLQHLDEEKPEGVENESQEQIAFADRIILNKCDLVGRDPNEQLAKKTKACEKGLDDADASALEIGNNNGKSNANSPEADEQLEKLEARIRAFNTHAKIIRTQYSQVDPKELLKMNAFDLDRVLEMDPEFLKPESADHQHDETVSSVSASLKGLELNINKLESWISEWIKELGNDLFRYKGVLAVKGCKQKFVFQGVHMLFSGGFSADVGISGKKTPAAIWQPDEQRECRFVFIGKNIKQKHGERILQNFRDCAAEETLRFNIGDSVEANGPEGWAEAKVIKVWDQGNPYRLEIQDGDKTNVWAPFDDEQYIRGFKK